MNEIITPTQAIQKEFNLDNNYLVDKCIDYLNAKIVSHDIYCSNDPGQDVTYYVIITYGQAFNITKVLDCVVSKLVNVGWDAFHGAYYMGGPSHAIFFRSDEFHPTKHSK